jgi:uncharacterized protein (TIGR03000 family)
MPVTPGTPDGTPVVPDGKKKKKEGKDDEEVRLDGSTPARLIVTLPANAKLTIDGNATASNPSVRRIFVTPPLPVGQEYYYTLRAEVMNEGKLKVIDQRVYVRGGETTQATLSLPASTVSAR